MKQSLVMTAVLGALFTATTAFANDHAAHNASAADAHSHATTEHYGPITDEAMAQQRAALAKQTNGKGYGPQAPRDIDAKNGANNIHFNAAPDYKTMNLCNIHFHKNAEHRGGEFTIYAGNGDGHGYQSGYKYSGHLTSAEITPVGHDICPSPHGGLYPGDTIEVHYVHSTAQVTPGESLGSCLSEADKNPQLRVETQVYVVVNDKNALDFMKLTEHNIKNGVHQALNIPDNTGAPIQYAGSTTGPKYNESGSPFQVSWSVRPQVVKVNIETVGQWCKGNTFKEDHAHGVRNLVKNPDLLSEIH